MGMLFGVGDEAAHSDIGTLTTHTLHAEVNWGTNGVAFLGINTENGSQAYVLERAGGVLSLYDGSNVTTGSAINTGQFYGITIVRAVGAWSIYIDGVLDISSTSNPTGINAHSLGNSLADSEASITGVMDGFKAWTTALNATQVLAEYGVEAAVLQTGLVTEANMNDGARTTAQTGTNLVETGTVLDGGEATYGAGDVDAPNVSLPTATGITAIAVTLGGTTDEANGTAHAIIVANGNESLPTNQEIIDGNYASELFEAVDVTISSTGVFTFAEITGLTANTTYGYAIVHEDASGNEDAGARVEGTFATLASASFTSDVLVNNAGSIIASTTVFWSWLPLGRIGSLTGVTPLEGSDSTDANGNLTISGMNAEAGILMVADRVTDATDDRVYYEAGTAA